MMISTGRLWRAVAALCYIGTLWKHLAAPTQVHSHFFTPRFSPRECFFYLHLPTPLSRPVRGPLKLPQRNTVVSTRRYAVVQARRGARWTIKYGGKLL